MNEITTLFCNGHTEEALKKLKILLAKENKLKYQKIMITLFELSLLEKDKSLREAVFFYNQINETTISEFLINYKKQFFKSIENKELEKAKIIKEVITQLQTLEYEYMNKCLNTAINQEEQTVETPEIFAKDNSDNPASSPIDVGAEMYKLVQENPRTRQSYLEPNEFKESDVPLIKARYY